MELVLDCPEHGMQPSGGTIHMTGLGKMTLGDVGGLCPICGRSAKYVPLTMEGTGDGEAAVRFWPSREQADRLQVFVDQARTALQQPDVDAQAVADQLIEQVGAVAPQAKSFFQRAIAGFNSETSKNLALWLGAVIIPLLIWYLTSVNAQGGISEDDLQRILEETVKSAQDGPPPTAPEDPTP